MTTHLATQDLGPDLLDELALIADKWTPLGKPLAAAFKDACQKDAAAHDGMVHPCRVSALLRSTLGADFNPRRFSAMWAPACGRHGFLEKTDVEAPIDPDVSLGNGNKTLFLRRWVG